MTEPRSPWREPAFWISLAGLLTIIAALWFTMTEAKAKALCLPWDKLTQELDRRKESDVGGGMAGPTVVIRVFASAGGATWTIVAVRTNGTACVIASGSDWEPGENPPVGQES